MIIIIIFILAIIVILQYLINCELRKNLINLNKILMTYISQISWVNKQFYKLTCLKFAQYCSDKEIKDVCSELNTILKDKQGLKEFSTVYVFNQGLFNTSEENFIEGLKDFKEFILDEHESISQKELEGFASAINNRTKVSDKIILNKIIAEKLKEKF